jgi:hypothetical protein
METNVTDLVILDLMDMIVNYRYLVERFKQRLQIISIVSPEVPVMENLLNGRM